MEGEHTGSSAMFFIFIFAIYSLVLIPYTLYKLCGGSGSGDEGVVKTWADKKKKHKFGDKLKATLGGLGWKLVVAWALYLLLFWLIQQSTKSLQPFDPFEILQLSEDATDKEIKKAYRQLSLQYHPDKNPDPKAAEYFAEYITKAYKALTDEVSRENYKKYGHPDGPQAMSVSVALPEWFFSKDKQRAPIILLVLLFGGIVTPLALAAAYLTRSNKFTGPNSVMHETVNIFLHPRYGVKESQALAKIPDTLVWAVEFLTLPTPAEQGPALDQLRRIVLRVQPDLKDKTAFWKNRPNTSALKVHMLLIAYLAREEIPAPLQKDLQFVLSKAPGLLQEMVGVANIIRTHNQLGGWLTPTLACLEMTQCLVQAVPLSSKKQQPISKSGESPSALLQLPHMDGDVLKKLARKRVRTLAELQELPEDERRAALLSCGLSTAEVEQAETMLGAMPALWVTAQCVIEGAESEEEQVIREGDIVTCKIQCMITRLSHRSASFDPDSIKGKAALAYAPHYPLPKEEQWYFVLGDTASNAVITMSKKSLLQAEAIGAKYAANWAAKNVTPAVSKLSKPNGMSRDASNPLLAGTKFDPFTPASNEGGDTLDSSLEELGQVVEFKFQAPRAGKYDLQLYCLPDCWVGCDRVVNIKLKVAEATRAEREGRRPGGAGLQRSAESEQLVGGSGSEDEGSEVDQSEGEDEGSEEEYDTDEDYETESEEEEDGGKKRK